MSVQYEPNIGETRIWSGNAVSVVATCLGWVFVMPIRGGRPFSIAYASWVDLPIRKDGWPKVDDRCPIHGSFVLELDGTRHCNFDCCGWGRVSADGVS